MLGRIWLIGKNSKNLITHNNRKKLLDILFSSFITGETGFSFFFLRRAPGAARKRSSKSLFMLFPVQIFGLGLWSSQRFPKVRRQSSNSRRSDGAFRSGACPSTFLRGKFFLSDVCTSLKIKREWWKSNFNREEQALWTGIPSTGFGAATRGRK